MTISTTPLGKTRAYVLPLINVDAIGHDGSVDVVWFNDITRPGHTVISMIRAFDLSDLFVSSVSVSRDTGTLTIPSLTQGKAYIVWVRPETATHCGQWVGKVVSAAEEAE